MAALVALGVVVLCIGVAAGSSEGPGLPNPMASTTTTEPCVRYNPGDDPELVFCPWAPT